MATNKRLIKSNDEGGAGGASFNTVLYTGNGTLFVDQPRAITGVGFQPDFTWIKSRTGGAYNHNVFDSVRGAGKLLLPNLTNAEITAAHPVYLDSFDNDGFTVNTLDGGGVNENGQNYVAWCWKAGGAAVTNTDGTITSQVSANTEAGFSIVSYNGGNSSGTTVGHGLGKQLDVLIVKNRNDGTDQWITWHKDVERNSTSTDTFTLRGGTIGVLNGTSAFGNYNYDGQMGSIGGESLIAYCFAEVSGFSKFGSYTGNGSTNGPTIDCGFEPAFVMIKWSSGSPGNWQMMDNKRGEDRQLYANLSNAEGGLYDGVDFLANGFKLKTGYVEFNGSGQSYIYMAFANQF